MSSHVLNYAMEKLKYAKDDNEKIAALFLVLKVDPRQYFEDNNLEKLYSSISPVFMYRLLKSVKKIDDVNFEEFVLGIQILSFFAMNETLMKRTEVVPMIECIFISCSLSQIVQSSDLIETICQIISCISRIETIKNMVIQKQLLQNYIDLIKYAKDKDSKTIISNCCEIINCEYDCKKIFKFYLYVTNLSTSLEGEKKLIIYDLILKLIQYFIKLKKYPAVNEQFNELVNIHNLSSYISHFFISSSSFKSKVIILLAHGLHLFSMDIFVSSLNNPNLINLFINLCSIDIQLYIDTTMNDKFDLIPINDSVESCCYILESFIRSIEKDEINSIEDYNFNTVSELLSYLNDFISDCPDEYFKYDTIKGISRLLSVLVGCNFIKLNLLDATTYVKSLKRLLKLPYFLNSELIIWNGSFLIKLCNDEKYQDDDIIDEEISDFVSLCFIEMLKNTNKIENLTESKLPEYSITLIYLIYHIVKCGKFDEINWNKSIVEIIDLIIKCFSLTNIETNNQFIGMLLLCGTIIIYKFSSILYQNYLNTWCNIILNKTSKSLFDKIPELIYLLKPLIQLFQDCSKNEYTLNKQLLGFFKIEFLKSKICCDNKNHNEEIINEFINAIEQITLEDNLN